jgi:hypothetical protein
MMLLLSVIESFTTLKKATVADTSAFNAGLVGDFGGISARITLVCVLGCENGTGQKTPHQDVPLLVSCCLFRN